VTHWCNVVLLAIMGGSGLQILVAYPYQGEHGSPYEWFPLQGWIPPPWLRIGEWLAGARHWHFAFAWMLVVNGLLYLGYLIASGEWRRRIFIPRRDFADALRTARSYLRFRNPHPSGELYNGLQRLAYTGALFLGALVASTGLAIYKPVALPWIASAFGGYVFARFVHFTALVLLALFLVGHVAMVLLHPRTLGEMITGGPRHE
jgi:thiosulfate reductase cytochrome b subunit